MNRKSRQCYTAPIYNHTNSLSISVKPRQDIHKYSDWKKFRYRTNKSNAFLSRISLLPPFVSRKTFRIIFGNKRFYPPSFYSCIPIGYICVLWLFVKQIFSPYRLDANGFWIIFAALFRVLKAAIRRLPPQTPRPKSKTAPRHYKATQREESKNCAALLPLRSAVSEQQQLALLPYKPVLSLRYQPDKPPVIWAVGAVFIRSLPPAKTADLRRLLKFAAARIRKLP